MSDQITLLPCAHCGGKAELFIITGGTAWGDNGYYIQCRDCKIKTCIVESPEIAASLYNRRAPQPLTVIAPPLEWGEWSGDEDLPVRWMDSRCGNYTIGHDLQKGIIEPFHQAGVLFTLGAKGTEPEAKAACQAHAQEQVNQAIKGCNVVEYKDPQPHINQLKAILREHNERVFKSLPEVGVSGLVELHTDMHRALKNELDQWEGK